MSTEKNIPKPTITSKTAAHGGKHGKAVEAPVHHVSGQRRVVASDEEKKEREMQAKRRGHGAHGHSGHGAHEGHGTHGAHEGHHNEDHH